MDWIVTHLRAKTPSTADLQREVANFIKQHLPSKGEKEHVKFRLGTGESLTILDAISVQVKLGAEVQYHATIPALDVNRAAIDEGLLRRNPGLLLGSTWGAASLCYDSSDESSGIRIIDFKPMQAGRVSLDAYAECRKQFTAEEWIDLIVRTMGYEPAEYSSQEKLWLLCRLIPIAQNRVNMMELAPPGSGKSYVFNNISRRVWVTTADITPAVLFYNRSTKTPGILTRYDLLVLDEAQSIRFSSAAEVQAQLKGYLEQGVYSRGDVMATAECGMMLLANIELLQGGPRTHAGGGQSFKPRREDFIRVLPEIFQESPLIDRFHGIIPGWEIPVFSTEQQARGVGLKADYFAEILHTLRGTTDISNRVRSRLGLSGGRRDCTAVERLASGLAKLLMIDVDHPRFEELVVQPASEMRRFVRSQLNAVDPQGYKRELAIRRAEKEPSLETIRHYELLEEIGEGGMARVYRCLDTETGQVVAMKRVSTDGMQDDRAIRREIDVYEKLRHIGNPHILAVVDVFRDASTYALVMEYANGGTLWDLLLPDDSEGAGLPLDEDLARDILLQIADGVGAMHDNEIVHRDLKPQNILQCDEIWKIADFGISKRVNRPVTGYTFQGAHTVPWAPPEQIAGSPAHRSADIYSLGRITAFLLTAREKPNDDEIPEAWQSLVATCTRMDPDARPDISEVERELHTL